MMMTALDAAALQLAVAIADEEARCHIECNCTSRRIKGALWWDTSYRPPDGSFEAVFDLVITPPTCARYLDLRALIVRHPTRAHLVRFVDHIALPAAAGGSTDADDPNAPFPPPPTGDRMTSPIPSLPSAIGLATLPPLGGPLADGMFAGVITQHDGTHHAVVLLAARPDGRVTWQQALDWAASVGGTLPARPVAALLYANVRDQVAIDWYWTSEPEGSAYAWRCGFGHGFQYCSYRSAKGCAVAVRLIPLAA